MHRELRRLAHYHLKSERADHTLQSTALVNEAFLRLMGSQPAELQNRAHFVAIASRLMRQILVRLRAQPRRKQARWRAVELPWRDLRICRSPGTTELVALDDALDELSRTR